MASDLIKRLQDEADLCRAETATDIAKLLDEAATALTEASQQAERYRWMRVAFVDFDDDGICNQALLPLGHCYTPEEVDAAIDAELAKAGASTT